MPLKFRETGLALSPTEIRKHCTAFCGGWAVGYIYYEAREGHGDEPHTWFWSIHGVLGKPIDMRGPRHRRVTGRHKKLFGRDLAEVADVGKPQRDGAQRVKGTNPPSRNKPWFYRIEWKFPHTAPYLCDDLYRPALPVIFLALR
jgi:hypothetical protein